MTKAEARKRALAARALAHGEGHDAAAQAHLLAFLEPYRGRAIAGYLPMRDEIDPMPVLAELTFCGPVGMPVTPAMGAPLSFRRWTPETEMEAGRFGTRQPVPGPEVVPEVLVMPLVSFDRAGNRLGYGGGYYDRTLAALPGAVAIGFAYAAQELHALPVEPTDVALTAIVTETGIIGPF